MTDSRYTFLLFRLFARDGKFIKIDIRQIPVYLLWHKKKFYKEKQTKSGKTDLMIFRCKGGARALKKKKTKQKQKTKTKNTKRNMNVDEMWVNHGELETISSCMKTHVTRGVTASKDAEAEKWKVEDEKKSKRDDRKIRSAQAEAPPCATRCTLLVHRHNKGHVSMCMKVQQCVLIANW